MSEQRNFILRCRQERDENGDPEEFTTDLCDLVDVDNLSYLSSDGLPQIGTRVVPGMLLVGKLGAKKCDERSIWNELQLLTANPQELQNYWRSRIYDGSLYAPWAALGPSSQRSSSRSAIRFKPSLRLHQKTRNRPSMSRMGPFSLANAPSRLVR